MQSTSHEEVVMKTRRAAHRLLHDYRDQRTRHGVRSGILKPYFTGYLRVETRTRTRTSAVELGLHVGAW
jgi:hypothetical protein